MKINKILIRYILVGAINTAFGYSMFVLLIYIGLHYSLAILLATIAGIFFNFKTLGRFVFRQSDWRLIWRFIAIYGLLYLLNICCVFVLLKYIQNVYVANALTIIFIAGLGFMLNRSFVYAKN